jgi:hypothetical protein
MAGEKKKAPPSPKTNSDGSRKKEEFFSHPEPGASAGYCGRSQSAIETGFVDFILISAAMAGKLSDSFEEPPISRRHRANVPAEGRSKTAIKSRHLYVRFLIFPQTAHSTIYPVLKKARCSLISLGACGLPAINAALNPAVTSAVTSRRAQRFVWNISSG